MTHSLAANAPTPRRLAAAWAIALRWKGRLFYAFADQGFYSASNLLLTILLASWLPLDDFGRYVVVWTVSLFVEAIQISLLIDPLPAIVSRYGRRNRQRIDAAAVWIVIGFSLASSLLIVLGALVLSAWVPTYATPLLVLAAVNPLQRIYLFFRRLCYIRDRQAVAAMAAIGYGAFSLGGAFVLAETHALSVNTALALSGFGAVAAIFISTAAGIGRFIKVRLIDVLWLASTIWMSGRWLTPAAIVSWLINWGIFPLIAAVSGASAAGIARALQNLLTPVVQFNAALNLAILPRVADKVADQGERYARKFAIRGTAIFTAAVLVYCGTILAAAPVILPLIYRKPEIAASAALLWPLGLAIVFEATRIASSMSLLATRKTRVVFLARLASLAAFAVAAAGLTLLMGFPGILWANAIGTAAGAAVVISAALRPAKT